MFILVYNNNKKYSVIVDKIDVNNDTFVDMAELKNWIEFTQRRYIEDDVNRQWAQHNPDNAPLLHWEVSLFIFIFELKRMFQMLIKIK